MFGKILAARRAAPVAHALRGLQILFAAATILALPAPQPASAQNFGAAPRLFVIKNDLGGDVGARANKITAMRNEGARVEIRGQVCYSACTMYLQLPGTCISRQTEFGFHRPSYYGVSLSPEQFEFWSQVIAMHYPPALASWYMREGRYSRSLVKISGAELIRLGVPECAASS